jgi:D-lactate dehydrogenase (cytochrome)
MDPKYLSDAAHFPGGHASGLVIPRTTAEIREIVRQSSAVLAVGAQSSLTGGATPMGELVLSTEKLSRVLDIGRSHIRVEAGVPVAAIQETLAARLPAGSSRPTRPARQRSGMVRFARGSAN